MSLKQRNTGNKGNRDAKIEYSTILDTNKYKSKNYSSMGLMVFIGIHVILWFYIYYFYGEILPQPRSADVPSMFYI